MKTKFNLLLMAVICLLTSFATAQSPKANLLVGTWKIKSLQAKFPENVTTKLKAKGEKIIADDEKDFKKTSFVFTKGGKLIIGKKIFEWKMNSEGTQVIVTRNQNPAITATILKLSEHQLVFTRPDEGMVVTNTLSR